ncbi:DUF1330 domain-containing protein [Nocardioides solisilvae]|uniref:DUF1330 domain-containing protein n=1 Tax=Nocardioides solisilvae TaxID=1542435 RepID=UPI000D74C6F3|nr:DUF1330 domain-containing protein [Nocardioides solisilvae]
MSAYLISSYREITDEAKVAAYSKLARRALLDAGARFLAAGQPEQVFEAGEKTMVVLMEFDSVEAAVAAYEGEAYQAALEVLDGGAVRDMRVLPGL